MPKDSLKEEIILKFKTFKHWETQTVRDRVSRFKINECPGCTQNAAAYILGLTEDVKIWGKLDKKDKDSLPPNVSDIVDKYKGISPVKAKKSKERKIKITSIIPNYASEFINAANSNNKVYPHIYVIENLLRKIILDVLGDSKSWWKTPPLNHEIIDYAVKIKNAEAAHPWMKKRGEHPIYYVGLEELKKIMNKFWENNFKWIGEREKFMLWIDELIPIRNMVAHNIQVEKEEIITTEQKSKWIITLINNKVSNK